MSIEKIINTFIVVFVFVAAGFGAYIKLDAISEQCDKVGAFLANGKAYECKAKL